MGALLVRDHPEIADLYRKTGEDTMSQIGIAKMLDIPDRYGVTLNLARNAISYALRGFDGDEDDRIASFDGLIPRPEIDLLYQHHLAYSGFQSWVANRQARIGIHARSHSEVIDDSMASVRARGLTPWITRVSLEDRTDLGETDIARMFVRNREYQYHDPSHSGRPNYPKIALKLNELFHAGKKVRTAKTVNAKLAKERARAGSNNQILIIYH